MWLKWKLVAVPCTTAHPPEGLPVDRSQVGLIEKVCGGGSSAHGKGDAVFVEGGSKECGR
jgi:hypothetical protein